MSIDNLISPKRLEPLQLIVAKLYEIADRMADQVATGEIIPQSVTVTTEWTSVVGAWIACDIYVDSGSEDVYVRLVSFNRGTLADRPWEIGEAPLKAGEHLPIRLGARTYSRHEVLTLDGMKEEVTPESPTIWMICQSGTATVRIFKLV